MYKDSRTQTNNEKDSRDSSDWASRTSQILEEVERELNQTAISKVYKKTITEEKKREYDAMFSSGITTPPGEEEPASKARSSNPARGPRMSAYMTADEAEEFPPDNIDYLNAPSQQNTFRQEINAQNNQKAPSPSGADPAWGTGWPEDPHRAYTGEPVGGSGGGGGGGGGGGEDDDVVGLYSAVREPPPLPGSSSSTAAAAGDGADGALGSDGGLAVAAAAAGGLDAARRAAQLLRQSRDRGMARAGEKTNELAEKALARAQEELGELSAAVEEMRQRRAADAERYEEELRRRAVESLNLQHQLEEVRAEAQALRGELEGARQEAHDALRAKGAMAWRLREAESEVEANRRLLNREGSRIVDSVTGETRAMVVERTKAEMRQHWARVRQIWEEEFQDKVRSREAAAEERVRGEMGAVVRRLRAELTAKVVELSNSHKYDQEGGPVDSDSEDSLLTTSETEGVQEQTLPLPHAAEADAGGDARVEELQEAVVAREVALLRARRGAGLRALAAHWAALRWRRQGAALRRWAASAAGAHFRTVTELAVAHHVRMAGAANIYVGLQRTFFSKSLGYVFRRWKDIVLHSSLPSEEDIKAGIVIQKMILIVQHKSKNHLLAKAMVAWKHFSDNKLEFLALHEEIKKLHQELSDIKSETWSLKRKLLKGSMMPAMA